MGAIFRRDFRGYFRTPVGYVFLFVFTALSGLIFDLYNLQSLSGDLLTFLGQLTLLSMLLCPLLAMRMFCEERQKNTLACLLTSPKSLFGIVLGKYLAAACVMLLAILLLQGCTLIIALGGQVYFGEWLTGTLGFTLQSLSFLALDLLVTCFAKNQMTGAASAFGANFLLWVADLLAARVPFEWMKNILSFLSLYDRYEPFRLGQFSFASTFYFITFIAACLIAAVRILDGRRFGEGGSL